MNTKEENELRPSQQMIVNIKALWEHIKAGGIRPFEDVMYAMYHIIFLLAENGYIDLLLEFDPFFTLWNVWKEHPRNKPVKQALITEVDKLLEIAQKKGNK